ncbi:hypothetical protein DMJ13_11775 [halophilic archaeon]|nr:hypothetical protein DMJ13_11775 [halophilic archaeon]
MTPESGEGLRNAGEVEETGGRRNDERTGGPKHGEDPESAGSVLVRGHWVAAGSALLGIWLVAAPFVVFEASLAPNFWSDVLAGVALLIVACYAAVLTLSGRSVTPAAAGFVGVVGLLQVAQPFVVGSASAANRWSDVAAGALLVAVAIVSFRQGSVRREESAESRPGGR